MVLSGAVSVVRLPEFLALGQHACAGHHDLFFSWAGDDIAEAKAICAGCPMRAACREFAMGDATLRLPGTGVWAGTDPEERRQIARERRRAMP